VRGGFIATNNKKHFDAIRPWLPVYEGFFTYGGMSSKESEAMAVGVRERTDLDVDGSSADMIKYFAGRMIEKNIPVVTPPGGLACHLDAMKFIPNVPQLQYPAGALAAAVYLVSGIRGMERGTVSMDRDKDGNDVPSGIELPRLAIPRRVFTMSHIEYATDRVAWLLGRAGLIGGLRFYEEPPVPRFFAGRMEALGGWGAKLADAVEKDFGPNC
jgi:tryptophanase